MLEEVKPVEEEQEERVEANEVRKEKEEQRNAPPPQQQPPPPLWGMAEPDWSLEEGPRRHRRLYIKPR